MAHARYTDADIVRAMWRITQEECKPPSMRRLRKEIDLSLSAMHQRLTALVSAGVVKKVKSVNDSAHHYVLAGTKTICDETEAGRRLWLILSDD